MLLPLNLWAAHGTPQTTHGYTYETPKKHPKLELPRAVGSWLALLTVPGIHHLDGSVRWLPCWLAVSSSESSTGLVPNGKWNDTSLSPASPLLRVYFLCKVMITKDCVTALNTHLISADPLGAGRIPGDRCRGRGTQSWVIFPGPSIWLCRVHIQVLCLFLHGLPLWPYFLPNLKCRCGGSGLFSAALCAGVLDVREIAPSVRRHWRFLFPFTSSMAAESWFGVSE